MKEQDSDSQIIYKILKNKREPLETKELQETAKSDGYELTRSKTLYRLNNMRGEGLVQGKSVGPSKGVWIWWINSDSQKKRANKDGRAP